MLAFCSWPQNLHQITIIANRHSVLFSRPPTHNNQTTSSLDETSSEYCLTRQCMYQFSWRETPSPSVYKTEEFVATLLVRPLPPFKHQSSSSANKQDNNSLDVQVFVLLTTNMKKSPKHEVVVGPPGSAAVKTQQTLHVKSSTPKVRETFILQ